MNGQRVMNESDDRPKAPWTVDWAQAPVGWNWVAQDGDGRWYWYRTRPEPGFAGRVWRSHSRNQRPAGEGESNPDWFASLAPRPPR